jgi:hypothetical protein
MKERHDTRTRDDDRDIIEMMNDKREEGKGDWDF